MPRKTRRRSSPTFLQKLRSAIDVDASQVRRVAAVTAVFVVAGAGAAGWAAGVPALERYAAAVDAGGPAEVRFVDPPAWMNGDLEAHLLLTAAQQLDDDPTRRDDLMAVREALLQTGWFTSIDQVRRVRRDLVEIRGRFVEPYAVVRDGAGDHLIDPSGLLLPRSVPVGQAAQFHVIIGAAFPRPGRPGEAWEGSDLTAALRLKRLIDGEPWHDQVRGIDVSRYLTDGVLMLVTDRGYPIVWGSAPGDEAAGEVSTERKLHYLSYPHEHFGHIDGGHDGELDITDPRGVFGR